MKITIEIETDHNLTSFAVKNQKPEDVATIKRVAEWVADFVSSLPEKPEAPKCDEYGNLLLLD